MIEFKMVPIDFVRFSEPCVVRMAYLEDYDHYPFSQCSAKRFTKPCVTSPTSEHYWINFFFFQTFTVVDEIWQFSTSDGWRDMWTNILIKHRNHILLHKHWCQTFIIWHSFIIPCYHQEAPTHIKAKLPSFKILDT